LAVTARLTLLGSTKPQAAVEALTRIYAEVPQGERVLIASALWETLYDATLPS